MSIANTKDNRLIVGDASESFSLISYDANKMRFDTLAADLSLRSLYTGKYYI